eukprot:gene2569-3183_t
MLNNIYISTISKKKQIVELVIKNEKYGNQEINQLIDWIRQELNIGGYERVKQELRGFLKSHPVDTYIKCTVKLEKDTSILSNGGGGCLGYVSTHIIDAYDTLDFSNVVLYTPSMTSKANMCVELLKSKFQIQQLVHLPLYMQNRNLLITSSSSTPFPVAAQSSIHNYNSQYSASAPITISTPSIIPISQSNNLLFNQKFILSTSPTNRTSAMMNQKVKPTDVTLLSPQIQGTKA